MADEQEVMLGKRHVPQKTGWPAFKEFMYNGETKTVMGRTGLSWLEITIFYIIFYSCLAAFWAISLALFVYTLDDKLPRWYGKGSIIGINPGVGYQPWLKGDPDSTLIYFHTDIPKSYGKYVDAMDAYLAQYDNTNNTRVCKGKESNSDDTDQACRFDKSSFARACSSGNNYGFDKGTPCVALALNRLIDWVPVAYPEDSIPANLDNSHYRAGDVAMKCRGENNADREHVGKVEYFPKTGLGAKYFPYRVMPNYHQPIAMVKFTEPTKNVIIQVECLAYSYNIIHDAINRMGLIAFELLIEGPKATKPDPSVWETDD